MSDDDSIQIRVFEPFIKKKSYSLKEKSSKSHFDRESGLHDVFVSHFILTASLNLTLEFLSPWR